MPSFKCSDTGMACPFQASAPNEAELMKKIAKHAKEAATDKEEVVFFSPEDFSLRRLGRCVLRFPERSHPGLPEHVDHCHPI